MNNNCQADTNPCINLFFVGENGFTWENVLNLHICSISLVYKNNFIIENLTEVF